VTDEAAALISAIEVVHARAIAELQVAAARFLELGEGLMCTLYEARARDLVVQRDRHLKAVKARTTTVGGTEHGDETK
jgi:hypothetical protein